MPYWNLNSFWLAIQIITAPLDQANTTSDCRRCVIDRPKLGEVRAHCILLYREVGEDCKFRESWMEP